MTAVKILVCFRTPRTYEWRWSRVEQPSLPSGSLRGSFEVDLTLTAITAEWITERFLRGLPYSHDCRVDHWDVPSRTTPLFLGLFAVFTLEVDWRTGRIRAYLCLVFFAWSNSCMRCVSYFTCAHFAFSAFSALRKLTFFRLMWSW